MEVHFKQYSITIADVTNYSLNSYDNIETFNLEHSSDSWNIERYYPTSKHGIRIFENNEEVNSAIICEVGGATGIHAQSFMIIDNNILICCCDKVYSIKIPELTINWVKRLDPCTCFGIYKFKGEIIIHGELQITRIDIEGNEKWSFISRDIFVTQDESEAIEIGQETIVIKDWEGYQYVLDENGKVLKNSFYDNL